MFDVCVEQAQKNTNQLLNALEKLAGIPDEEFSSMLCGPLRDSLSAVPRAIEKLNQKAKEHRRAQIAQMEVKPENGKEHAA
jgi:hypothetical protein